MVMFEAFDNFRVEAISKSLAALPHPDPCFQIPGAFDNERWLGRDGLHGPNVERAKPQLPQGRDCAFLLTAGRKRFFSAEVRKMSVAGAGRCSIAVTKLSIPRQCAALHVARSGRLSTEAPANNNERL
jgi:hypothetical protein